MSVFLASLATVMAAVVMRAGLRHRNRKKPAKSAISMANPEGLKCPVCSDRQAGD